jgi:hypothetical protein
VVHGCGGSGYEAGNAGQFGSRKPTDHKSKGKYYFIAPEV